MATKNICKEYFPFLLSTANSDQPKPNRLCNLSECIHVLLFGTESQDCGRFSQQFFPRKFFLCGTFPKVPPMRAAPKARRKGHSNIYCFSLRKCAARGPLQSHQFCRPKVLSINHLCLFQFLRPDSILFLCLWFCNLHR